MTEPSREPPRRQRLALTWMALVLGASLVTLQARKSLLRPSGADETDDSPAEASKLLAWLMLFIWGVVIFCGRFIAYT